MQEISEGQGQLCIAPGHSYGPRGLPRPVMSSWSLAVIRSYQHQPLSLHSHRPSLGPQQQHWPRLKAVGLATHNRLFFSTLKSSIPSLFTRFKLFCFSLSHLPITHLYIVVVLVVDDLGLQTGHEASRPLGDLPCPCSMIVSRSLGVYSPPM